MLLLIFFLVLLLIGILYSLFYALSKSFKWEKEGSLTFECGFSSYFFSRFSFSMHYFMVALIFLLFDLELCVIMPYFNLDFNSISLVMGAWILVMLLTLGLIMEWKNGQLDWVS